MANTSATGGILTPDAVPAPLEDDALDDALQALVVGVTGLDPTLVRPRWQPNPPKQPEPAVDWCAIGITDTKRDPGPALAHDPAGQGTDYLQRHEDISVLASFYGPNAGKYAAMAADGLTIPQNSESLQTHLMRYVNSDTIRQVPELVNNQWIKRRDLPLFFRRQVVRVYSVENIASSDFDLTPDQP